MKKFASLLLTVVLLATMLSVFAVPASADTEAYDYPGNCKPENGYYFIRNAGTGDYLGCEKIDNTVRYCVQQTGDLFQISKIQLATGKGKEEAYAYQIKIVASPVADVGHTLRVVGSNGYPESGTEIDDGADFGLWFQRWAFDNANDGKVLIRTYLDNDPNKGIPGVHPFLDIKSDTADNRVCLYDRNEARTSQLWELKKVDYTPIGGKGTEKEPYTISSAEQLAQVGKFISHGWNYSGCYFKLTDNITYNGPKIGDEKHAFSGIFDGDMHVITAQISSGSYTGLFASLDGATVKNLKIEGTISGTGSGASAVGAVAGNVYNKTVIDNCFVTANVTGTEANIGGIAGAMSNSRVSNCRMDGNVTNYGWTSTGGIVGGILGGGDIINCLNTGTVTGNKAVGGILGCVIGGETLIGNCSSLGSTAEYTKDGGDEHGGIVGFIDSNIISFVISNSFSKCQIGVSKNSGYLIGNNENVGKASAYFVYYIDNGALSGIAGKGGNMLAGNSRTYTVRSSNYSTTLSSLNNTANNYNQEGYPYSTWERNGSSFFPTSCKEFSVNNGTTVIASILSEGILWIVIAIAVLALGGVAAIVIVKKKKKTALAKGENKDEE